jgi:hypothetical protein
VKSSEDLVQIKGARKTYACARVVGCVARVLSADREHRLHEYLACDRVAHHVRKFGADVAVPIDPAFGRYRARARSARESVTKVIGSDQARSLLSMVVIDNAGWLSEIEPGLLVPRLSVCALEAGS